MDKCRIEKCDKKVLKEGFCHIHYMHYKHYWEDKDPSEVQISTICKITNCNKEVYAKELCKKHYEKNRKYGDPLAGYEERKSREKCKISSCSNKYYAKGYCQKHYGKLRRYDNPLEPSHKYTNSGNTFGKESDNPNWKGGVSEYSNHNLMKKIRLIKLQQTERKCEICGNKANMIHHIDGSKDNHKLNNLKVVCRSCHTIIHHSGTGKKTSKYIRLHGMTLKEMSNKFGGSSAKYSKMHKEGKLKDFLKEAKQRRRKKEIENDNLSSM